MSRWKRISEFTEKIKKESTLKISVLIPMYNEISTVRGTADALTDELESFCASSGDEYEIIFSDDGSTDGSCDAVPKGKELSCGSVRCIRSEQNRGKGAAVRHAVLASSGEAVVYTDCDLAYGTAVIHDAVEVLRSGDADAVIGSRAIHPDGYNGYTALRRLTSKAYMHLLSGFAGFRLSDSQCGIKAFRGDLARDIFSEAETDGWAFDFEIIMLALQRGAKIRELPVKVINHRKSRIHIIRDSFGMVKELCKIKRRLSRSDQSRSER